MKIIMLFTSILIVLIMEIHSAEKITIEHDGKEVVLESEDLDVFLTPDGKEAISKKSALDTVQSYFRVTKKQLTLDKSFDKLLEFYITVDEKLTDKKRVATFFKSVEGLFAQKLVIKNKVTYDDIEVIAIQFELNGEKFYMGFFTKKIKDEYLLLPYDFTLQNKLAGNLSACSFNLKEIKELYELKAKKKIEKIEKQKIKELEKNKPIEKPNGKNEKNNIETESNKIDGSPVKFNTVVVMNDFKGKLNETSLDKIRKIEPIVFIQQYYNKFLLCVGVATTDLEKEKLKGILLKIRELNGEYKNAYIKYIDNGIPDYNFLIEALFGKIPSNLYLFEPGFYYGKSQEEFKDLKNMRESYSLIFNQTIPQILPENKTIFNEYVLTVNSKEFTKDNIENTKKILDVLKLENGLIEIHFNCWLVENIDGEEAMATLIEKIPLLRTYESKNYHGNHFMKFEAIEYILRKTEKSKNGKLRQLLIACLENIKYDKLNSDSHAVYQNEAWEVPLKLIKKIAISKSIDLSESFKEFNLIKPKFEMGTTDSMVNEVEGYLSTIEDGTEKKIKETLIKSIDAIKTLKIEASEQAPFKPKLWENIIERVKKIAMDNKIDLSDSLKALEGTKTILEPKTIYDE